MLTAATVQFLQRKGEQEEERSVSSREDTWRSDSYSPQKPSQTHIDSLLAMQSYLDLLLALLTLSRRLVEAPMTVMQRERVP